MATKWFRVSGHGGVASATQLRRALGFSSSAVADSALAASATSVAKPGELIHEVEMSKSVL